MKKLMPLLTLTLLLSGCSLINSQSSSNSNSSESSVDVSTSLSSSQQVDLSSSSNENTSSNSKLSISSSSINEDLNINLVDPDFSTRKILSKEEVKYTDLFNLGNRVKIDIQISDNELNKLQSDFEQEGKPNV